MRSLTLLTFLALVVPSSSLSAAELPVRKLYVLLAVDTASNLKPSVMIDQEGISRLLRANVPADRLDIQTITGTKLTGPNVLAHFRAAKVGPEDAILFFYAGHGAKDPDKGHAFTPQMLKVDPIYRSDVREAMKKTGAGLIVILSDCCSSKAKLVGKPSFGNPRPVVPASATGIHPTLEHLFFRHRGVVDVTAATDGECSYGDFKSGGMFTHTLTEQLLKAPDEFDMDGDHRVSWREFVPALTKATDASYRAYKARALKSGADATEYDQAGQRPNAFSLGEQIAGGESTTANVEVYAVLCLANESGEAVKYKYRLLGQADWQSVEIPSGKRGEHAALRGKVSSRPRFEILFEGNKSPLELEADTWSGSGQPPRGAAGREYPILLRKKDK